MADRLKQGWVTSLTIEIAAKRVANLAWAMLPEHEVLAKVIPLGMRVTAVRDKTSVQVTFRKSAALQRDPYIMACEVFLQVVAKTKT